MANGLPGQFPLSADISSSVRSPMAPPISMRWSKNPLPNEAMTDPRVFVNAAGRAADETAAGGSTESCSTKHRHG